VFLQNNWMDNSWLSGSRGSGDGVVTGNHLDGGSEQTKNKATYQWQVRSDAGDGSRGSADSKAAKCVQYGDVVFLQNNWMDNRWLSGSRSSEGNGVATRNHLDGGNEENDVKTTYQWQVRSNAGDGSHGPRGSADPKATQCVQYGDIVFLQNRWMDNRWLSGSRGSGDGVGTWNHLDGGYEENNVKTTYQWQFRADAGDGSRGSADVEATPAPRPEPTPAPTPEPTPEPTPAPTSEPTPASGAINSPNLSAVGSFVTPEPLGTPLTEADDVETVDENGMHLHLKPPTLVQSEQGLLQIAGNASSSGATPHLDGCAYCQDSSGVVARDSNGNGYTCQSLGAWCSYYSFVRNNCRRTCGCWQYEWYSHGTCNEANKRPIGSADECRVAIAELSPIFYITRPVFHFNGWSHLVNYDHLWQQAPWPRGCFVDVHGWLHPNVPGYGPLASAPYFAGHALHGTGSHDYQLICATRPPHCAGL